MNWEESNWKGMLFVFGLFVVWLIICVTYEFAKSWIQNIIIEAIADDNESGGNSDFH